MEDFQAVLEHQSVLVLTSPTRFVENCLSNDTLIRFLHENSSIRTKAAQRIFEASAQLFIDPREVAATWAYAVSLTTTNPLDIGQLPENLRVPAMKLSNKILENKQMTKD